MWFLSRDESQGSSVICSSVVRSLASGMKRRRPLTDEISRVQALVIKSRLAFKPAHGLSRESAEYVRTQPSQIKRSPLTQARPRGSELRSLGVRGDVLTEYRFPYAPSRV
jgi:hypothetical protein